MKITLSIESANPVEMQEAITGLAGIMGGAVVSQPVESEKPKRNSSKSTHKQEEKKSELDEKLVPEVTDQDSSESEDTEKVPTVVELRAKAAEKGQSTEGKKQVKALLDEFGAKSISEVEEADRASFMKRLEEL